MKKILILISVLLALSSQLTAQSTKAELISLIRGTFVASGRTTAAQARTVYEEMVNSAFNVEDDTPQQAQFSADGASWHNLYQSSDIFVRFSPNGTSWSAKIPVFNTNMDIDSNKVVNVLAATSNLDAVNLKQLKDSTALLLRLTDVGDSIATYLPVYLTDLDSAGFTLDTMQIRNLAAAINARISGSVFSGSFNDLTNVPLKLDTDSTDNASIASLTSGYVPYMTTNLVNSPIYTNGTDVSIGSNQIYSLFGLRTNGLYSGSVDNLNDLNGKVFQLNAINEGENSKTGFTARFAGEPYVIGAGIILQREGSLWGTSISFFTHGNNTNNDEFLERVKINSDGKVGINTTLPTEKLDVNGNIIADTVKLDMPISVRTGTNQAVGADSVRKYVDDVAATLDPSATNELQALSFSGDTLYLSNGNYIYLGAYANPSLAAYMLKADSTLYATLFRLDSAKANLRSENLLTGGSGYMRPVDNTKKFILGTNTYYDDPAQLYVFKNESSAYAAKFFNIHSSGNGIWVQGGTNQSTGSVIGDNGGTEYFKFTGNGYFRTKQLASDPTAETGYGFWYIKGGYPYVKFQDSTYNLVTSTGSGAVATTFDGLSDVTITSAATWHVPYWNGSEWANALAPVYPVSSSYYRLAQTTYPFRLHNSQYFSFGDYSTHSFNLGLYDTGKYGISMNSPSNAPSMAFNTDYSIDFWARKMNGVANTLTDDSLKFPTNHAVYAAIQAAGGFTAEDAQDAVGAALDNASVGTINFAYDDNGNKISATIKNSGVTAGSYTNANITIGADGRATAISNGSAGGSGTYLGLTDTPSSFTANYFVKVNSGGTALEHVAQNSIGLSGFNNNANFITSSGVTYTNLNANGSVGTGASQVAAGNHGHSGTYEPANANIQSHISATNNPHSVTASQVGNATAQWNASKLQDFDIDTTDPTDGKILVYRSASSKYVLEDKPVSSGSPAWGEITGTLSAQTDLNTALSGKQATLTGSESVFNGWDKNASDDFNGAYSSLTGKPTSIYDFSGISNTGWAEGKVLKFNSSGGLVVGTDNVGESGGIALTDLSAASPLAYNNTTGQFSVGTGYSIPTATQLSNAIAAYNTSISSASFNTTDGVITLSQLVGGGSVTVDIDGRFLTSEVDGSTTNEIQDLSGSGATLSGYVLSLSSDGTTVTLPNEADGSTTNEIEVVDEAYSAANMNGGTTSAVSQDDFYDYNALSDTDDDGLPNKVDLSSAGFVKTDASGNISVDGNTYLQTEVDGSTTNELQTLTGDVSSTGTTTLTTTIGNDKITEAMLKSVNSPTDEYALTYESTTGDFEWQAMSGGNPTLADIATNSTSTAHQTFAINDATNFIVEDNNGTDLFTIFNDNTGNDLDAAFSSDVTITDSLTIGRLITNYGIQDIDTFTCDTTIVTGNLCVLTSTGMKLADCDDLNRTRGLLAIAMEPASAGNTGKKFLLKGYYSVGVTMGLELYLSNTPGGWTSTAPTTAGDYLRIIGWWKNSSQLYFNPEPGYILLK